MKKMEGLAASSKGLASASTRESIIASATRTLREDEGDLQRNESTKRQKTENNRIVSSAKAKGSDVLTLNIGGKDLVMARRSTLTNVTGSELAETFSGRWDDSLPKDKDGNFYIDHEPEIFLPLLKFLRSLNCVVTSDLRSDRAPPITPCFSKPLDKNAFYRMVDSYGLTNVLFNYEIYSHPNNISLWNNVSLASQGVSVLDYSMAAMPNGEVQHFSLDRPMQTIEQSCHDRQVQSFEVTAGQSFCGQIGWIGRAPVACNDVMTFRHRTRRLLFTPKMKKICFANQQNEWTSVDLPELEWKDGSKVRCAKHHRTGDFEFYVDGVLVVGTTKALDLGTIATMIHAYQILGFSVPGDHEMIPYVNLTTGSCHFSAIQLED
ncbi:hypothetical protein MPSEU_000337500 [Mayamaea pseudoterrestris]|nr:hypothetical protein MPSEU_000337500 [Mayamaea pseudoterrestris]